MKSGVKKKKTVPPVKKPVLVAKRGGAGTSATEKTPAPVVDNRPAIEISIERGNRMAIRWPSSLSGLTQQLEYKDSDIADNLLGNIEELKDGTNKKLTPLNFINAHVVLRYIMLYESMDGPDGLPLYRVSISDDFSKWFREELQAKALAEEAYKVIDYDDPAEVWKRFSDASPVSHVTARGDVVHQVSFPWLKLPLYAWQATAMDFLNIATRHGRGAFVCDETGLGKTIEVLAHLMWLKEQAKKTGIHFGGAIVVCPAGLVEGWARKTKMTTDFTVSVVESEYPLNAWKSEIIIVSYDMLKKRGIWPLSDYVENQHRVLVVDEGHFAKNYDSTRASMTLLLSVYARHTVVMTATPIKNRVLELHPLLRATRRLWTEMSLKDFVKTYDNPDDPESRAEVAEHLQGIMVRRRMGDVWVNPPKGELGAAWVKLSNRKDYDEVERDFIEWLMRQGASHDKLQAAERGRALVKMNKLRELSANGKVPEAIKMIDTTLNHDEQAVVFCAFTDPLKTIASHFRNKTGKNFKGQRWRGAEVIIGATPKHKRMQIIDAFNRGELGCLCLGVTAGGIGIDLPIARVGYFLDYPWTPADFEQCTGRLLRLGQERDCQFVKLLAERTIDHRMQAIIEYKATIFAEAIGDEEALERVTAKDALEQDTIVSALIQNYIRDPEGLYLPA